MISNLKRYTLYIVNLTDILSMIIAYGITYLIRSNIKKYAFILWHENDYSRFLLAVILGYVVFNILSLYNDDKFLKRTSREEFVASVKMVFYVMVTVILYLYVMKISFAYSRLFVGLYALVLIFVDFAARVFVRKMIIPMFKNSGKTEKVVILSSYDDAAKTLEKINKMEDWRFVILGFIISDRDMKDEEIEGYKVLSTKADMFSDIETMDADSVMIVQNLETDAEVESWLIRFRELGKIIHVQIDEFDVKDSYRGLDRIGDCPVVSYHNIAPMPKRQALLRRLFSLIIAICVLPLFIIVFLITWIFSRIESKGSILVKRVRVGVNTRRFYQYRFRYYRMDADERITNGQSPYSAIGRFLRFTHLDGLPQILNVISGEMDLIGPKAPSLPRYLDMSAKDRNKLCIRPGMIGYWSSDRNARHVSRAEDEYVLHWNVGKDALIILVTMLRYITLHSLRKDSETHISEELEFIREEKESLSPLPYDRSLYTKRSGTGYTCYLFVKRLLDIILSLAAIIMLSPVLLILTILVIADDGGSPFYGHKRVGKDGNYVTIYKFRSMRQDAGDLQKLLTPEQLEQYRREFKIDNDPRITKIGNFIRKTSLDELPQLFNILFGSLSVVGPRPIVTDETKIYGDEIGKLLSVKPGLTGYWQAYARNNATYESGERQRMEMYYVDNASLWLDIKIVFKTFISVLKREGAQ